MKEVINKFNCTGCSACMNSCPKNAIRMEYSREGFLYPKIDTDKCINCNLCKKICPVLNTSKNISKNSCYVGYIKNDKVIMNSSSGGIFYVLANNILENNGIVIGAAFDKKNKLQHIAIEEKKEINKLMGSKYIQSNLNNIYSYIKERVKKDCEELIAKGIKPTLAVILVGEDKASQTYVASKEKACIAAGMGSVMHRLGEQTTQNELLSLIEVLNKDDSIHGILVQLPLPKHLDTNEVLRRIDPNKDVDGFHALNVGKLNSGLDGFVPCTPLGIMEIFKEYNIDLVGKNALVIGRSNIVGKPMAALLLNAGATVTIAHSKTKNLAQISRSMDIIVVAIGKPKFLSADMVGDGAIIIDVGINRLDDGSLCGDADFEAIKDKCSFITPVPGGVGPMTIAMLLSNTIKSAKNELRA